MAGRPWAKIWPDKWLASARVRRVPYEAQGLFWAVFVRAAASNDSGELRTGPKAWTVADLALDLGVDRRRQARLEQRLDALLEAGLLERRPDGCLAVARWDALQAALGAGAPPQPAEPARNGHEAPPVGERDPGVAALVDGVVRATRMPGARRRNPHKRA